MTNTKTPAAIARTVALATRNGWTMTRTAAFLGMAPAAVYAAVLAFQVGK